MDVVKDDNPSASPVSEDLDAEYEEDDGIEVDDAIEKEEAEDRRSEVSPGEDDVEDDAEELSGLQIQHGAHREYSVPEHFVIHRATDEFQVSGGKEIGELVASRSPKVWKYLSYSNVTILGGRNKITGLFEEAPYVTFHPPAGTDSDDWRWARPVPNAVMRQLIPGWLEQIKEEEIDLKNEYDKVLKWTEDKLPGQRLVPDNLQVGKGGFRLLTTKMRSIRVSPEVVPRKNKASVKAAVKANPKTHLVSAITKTDPTGKGSTFASAAYASSETVESDASDVTAMPDARVIRIGPVGTTITYQLDGMIYATLMA